MNCNNCGGVFVDTIDLCPDCKTLLPIKGDRNEDIMVRIIANYKLDIYNDISSFNKVIRNLYSHDDKLCRLLQIIIAYGSAKKVFKLQACTTESDYSKEYNALIEYIDDTTFIPPERFLPALELLLLGIGKSKMTTATPKGEKQYLIKNNSIVRYLGKGGDVVIPNDITSIGNNAFSECKGVTSIVIPNSVTSIGNGAFTECINLTSIIIPNSVILIGENAFEGCIRLTSIEIPNSVSMIEKNLFRACTNLTKVVLPDSIASIGDFAFVRCSGLVNFRLPSSISNIGVGAFADCSNLKNINVTKDITFIGASAFMRCGSLDDFTGKLIKKMSPLAIK